MKNTKEKFLSYSELKDDLIVYHLLKDEKIFYIDIGANDPEIESITKNIYDKGIACGINIEPQNDLYLKLENQRKNDINLCVAVGEKNSEEKLYLCSSTGASLNKQIADSSRKDSPFVEVMMTTFYEICKKYVPIDKDIHLLKIDVEGFEKNVLLGANFDLYRPWIIMIEAAVPMSDCVPTYEDWETLITDKGYLFAKQYGINRFYIKEEKKDLINKFIEMVELEALYDCVYAIPEMEEKALIMTKVSDYKFMEEKLLEKNNKKVGLYGYGEIGRKLNETLSQSKIIEVMWIIDKNWDILKSEEVRKIDEIQNNVDVIIITPYYYYDDIVNELQISAYKGKYISVDQLY